MTRKEQIARDYCISLGLDPDEVVAGYWAGDPERLFAARWCWYVPL